jgi:HAD superfamily hydrolase (TIGR01549 family)
MSNVLFSTVAANMKQQRPTLRGVVFDMDGTLTVPNLDFGEMYRRCEVDSSQDILKVLATLPLQEAQAKFQIIQEMEEESTRTMKVMPGAPELMKWLATHKIPTALVTRNTAQSAKALQERLQHPFDAIVARDTHEHLPPKPDAAAMHYICKEVWSGMDPSNVIMVGDSPANDIVFGKAAGAQTALLHTGREVFEADKPKTDEAADIHVEQLYSLPHELWKSFEIESAFGTNIPLLKYDIPPPPPEGWVKNIRPGTIHVPDESGNTPLIWAAELGDEELATKILGMFTNLEEINTKGYLGATAVNRAARRGHSAVLEVLLKAGANPDISNAKLQYPLHFAAYKQNMDAVELLLKYGANPHVLDRKGRIPAMDTKNEAIRTYIYKMMRES